MALIAICVISFPRLHVKASKASNNKNENDWIFHEKILIIEIDVMFLPLKIYDYNKWIIAKPGNLLCNVTQKFLTWRIYFCYFILFALILSSAYHFFILTYRYIKLHIYYNYAAF